MKLRTQISLLLFLFGLIPLLVAFVINIPMIFDRIEILYHKAYIQNLRARFSDLDQYIGRRQEMARLLAKIPEPGMLLTDEEQRDAQGLESARSGYVDWVNQVLADQLDITRILFLDADGNSRFWLERDLEDGRLQPHKEELLDVNPDLVEAGRSLSPGGVMTGPIVIDPAASQSSPNRFMQLSLISPVVIPIVYADSGEITERRGEVIIYLDMGGLTNAYRGNYWVQSDGHYLGDVNDSLHASKAFEDFPGLEQIFAKGELDLWAFNGQQVMWVPLFDTEHSGPIWVGRSVDPSPLTTLLHAVNVRVAIVAAGLLIVVFVVARLIAVRAERLGHELTDGISRVLKQDEAVNFSWKRPEELHELGTHLTRLANTHAEHNRALHNYAEELEASNRYKSEFLANVSHELRTPLNSILLLSKMLADNSAGQLSSEESRQAQIIHAAGTDLKALIDNILDLSRVEARQMLLVSETVDLRKLVMDVIELLKPQFDHKQLQLSSYIEADVPESIVSDGEKLRQILINFLSNAVKFTKQGGVTVKLQRGTSSPVCISVTDTGIGIPADKLELVFEAFKQADGSTSRRFGGTGLGLTISRELARLMGGEIQVASELGKGTTFSLLLPLKMPVLPVEEGSNHASGARQDKPAREALPTANYQGARILLVDDDVRNLLALTPLLEQWGLDVMAAGDGQEALETLATAGPFDVLLLDIMMPGMDGYEVIRQVRKQTGCAEIPVIALTAKASKEDRQQCLAAGANECVVKPLEPQRLKLALDVFLSDKRKQPENTGKDL
ncbi:MAG: response regulator [Gammaproteobacteria bacterium]|jgi:signal transduction histidine kinase/ActR/RegA family two-component response regulator|nr:response regulator [Gammaproteobacteria bacterium]